MESRFDRLVSLILTGGVVVASGFLIEGRFNRPAGKAPRAEKVKNWDSLFAKAAVPLGKSGAKVELAVFTDFECPFCRVMDSVLSDLEAQYPHDVSRSVIQYPLPMHKYASAAAVAFECAAAQRYAKPMHHVLYSSTAEFSDTSWTTLAVRAGVPDTSAFAGCMVNEKLTASMVAGHDLAGALIVTGTPTVVVNGWMFRPSFPEEIKMAVERVLDGKSPKP